MQAGEKAMLQRWWPEAKLFGLSGVVEAEASPLERRDRLYMSENL